MSCGEINRKHRLPFYRNAPSPQTTLFLDPILCVKWINLSF